MAWRIEQLLRAQEALPAPTLNGWQADTVLAAIEALDEERFADGERAIMKAERTDLWEPSDYIARGPMDVRHLMGRLKKAIGAT